MTVAAVTGMVWMLCCRCLGCLGRQYRDFEMGMEYIT
jgi:hypothetical protein